MIFGPTYASIKCGDQGYNLCNEMSTLSSKDERVISKCTKNPHCISAISITTGKKDFCCQKKNCPSETNLFLSTQNSNPQTQSLCFLNIDQNHQSKELSLRTLFDQYKYRSAQSVSIYTLIKSFLC